MNIPTEELEETDVFIAAVDYRLDPSSVVKLVERVGVVDSSLLESNRTERVPLQTWSREELLDQLPSSDRSTLEQLPPRESLEEGWMESIVEEQLAEHQSKHRAVTVGVQDGEWVVKDRVRVIRVNGSGYLKTRRSEREGDELGFLPSCDRFEQGE